MTVIAALPMDESEQDRIARVIDPICVLLRIITVNNILSLPNCFIKSYFDTTRQIISLVSQK